MFDTSSYQPTKCVHEVPGMILLQVYLYTHSLLRGVNFEVLPLGSHALSPTMLSLLGTFVELLIWNSFQCRRHIFWGGGDFFNILKSSSL
jgi:hypothetical protein